MADEFERRLRSSMREATGDLRRDPDAWDDLHRRVRRKDLVRNAFAAVGAAAAVAAAVVVLPGLTGADVSFEPADRPGAPTPSETVPAPTETESLPPVTEPTSAATPPPAATAPPLAADLPSAYPEAADACGGVQHIAVVFAADSGALQALCAQGGVAVLADESAAAQDAAVAPDGTAVVFERGDPGDGGTAQLIHLDLETGDVESLTDGRLPAFAPDGTLAWVQGQPGEAVIRAGEPFAEPHFERLAGVEVTSVSWDADSRHLYATDLFADSGEAVVLDTRSGTQDPGAVIPLDNPGSGSRHLAVSGTPTTGTVGLIHRKGLEDGIALIQQMDVLPDPSAAVTLSATDLASVLAADTAEYDAPGLDYAAAAAVEPGGDVAPQWLASDADAPSWLVTDGDGVWLVGADGSITNLHQGVRAAAMNPALELGPSAAGPDGGTHQVQVFFGAGDGTDCAQVAPVVRTVEGDGVLRGALEALLAGPTPDEGERGAQSLFSGETAGLLLGVRIEDGTAYVDFEPALRDRLPNASTSCGSAAMLSQLDATVTQFPTVDRAVYSLGGDVDAFYQDWLQGVAPEQ